jgi:hypothetical protein
MKIRDTNSSFFLSFPAGKERSAEGQKSLQACQQFKRAAPRCSIMQTKGVFGGLRAVGGFRCLLLICVNLLLFPIPSLVHDVVKGMVLGKTK